MSPHDDLRPAFDPMVPAWHAPANVGALFTRRQGGVSTGRWSDAQGRGGLNLGAGCGDEPQRVALNRSLVAAHLGMRICWLTQVHGSRVHEITAAAAGDPAAEQADAQVTEVPGIALGVLVADCLPVLLADRRGTIVGIAHAGWRGLAAGVLENTLASMRRRRSDADIVAWLGPCIGADAFEVGEDVLAAFATQDPQAKKHFRPRQQAGKWSADLAGLAKLRLAAAGVSAVADVGACTVADKESFWSYRRDGICGRMAGLIWLRG